jgi:hypothetical protein
MTKNPPSLTEVEAALLEMRQPYERRLLAAQLQRDRFIEEHRNTTALVDPVFVEKSNKLRTVVRSHQRVVDKLPQSVYRTVVLCNPETEELSVVAVVQDDSEISSVTVRGWEINCVTSSFHLLRCKVGEVINQGLVVSVNGSQVMPAAKQKKTLAALQEPPLSRREQRQRERMARRMLFERFTSERKRREQEWQEKLLQQRRVREEKENAIRDKLLREAEEKEGRRKRDLEEWGRQQRERAGFKPKAITGSVSTASVVEQPEIDPSVVSVENEAVQAMPEPETVELFANPLEETETWKSAEVSKPRQPLGPLHFWYVLSSFVSGCACGFFLLPPWFSLVGVLFAVVTSFLFRVARRFSPNE